MNCTRGLPDMSQLYRQSNSTNCTQTNQSFTNLTTHVNSTVTEFQESATLRLAYDVTVTVTLTIIILGMGCGVTWDLIKFHIKRPTGVAIGLVSQVIVLPFLSFALAHALVLEPTPALGMLVMGVSPCGMMSSVFSYWMGGDVSLSFTMSTFSTFLAFGTIPLNLLIYSGSWTEDSFVIPYKSILLVVGMTCIPLLLGLLLRWKFPKVAFIILKIGSVAGMIIVALYFILLSLLYPFIYSATWKIYIAALSYPYICFMFGYVVSTLFKIDDFRRRTIALETGMQNYTLCFAILESSFSSERLTIMSVFPLLYGVNSLTAGVVFVGIYKCLKKYAPEPMKEELKEPADDKVETDDVKSTGQLLEAIEEEVEI